MDKICIWEDGSWCYEENLSDFDQKEGLYVTVETPVKNEEEITAWCKIFTEVGT